MEVELLAMVEILCGKRLGFAPVEVLKGVEEVSV
jgi:hypothetical protein